MDATRASGSVFGRGGRLPRLIFRELEPGIFVWRRGSNGGLIQGIGVDRKHGLLVDTGTDDATAQALLQKIQQFNWQQLGIFHTHSHPDHIHGTTFLLSRIPGKLWQPSAVPARVYGRWVQFLALPGHTEDSFGIGVDRVLFAGDAVFAEEILARSPVPSFQHIDQALRSLDRLEEAFRHPKSPFRWLVPGHGFPRQGHEAIRMIRRNRDAVDRALQRAHELWFQNDRLHEGPQEHAKEDPRLVREWLRTLGMQRELQQKDVLYWARIAKAYVHHGQQQ